MTNVPSHSCLVEKLTGVQKDAIKCQKEASLHQVISHQFLRVRRQKKNMDIL